MKILSAALFAGWLLALAACTTPASREPSSEAEAAEEAYAGETEPLLRERAAASVGQTIYVPVYSHIYYRDDRRVVNLAATLSIRNTDAVHGLVITAVRYYDSNGQLVRRYLQQPLALGPMATKDYVVEQDDTSGGSGANFIVEWTAEAPVTPPVVEAVMISTASSQGISFTSPGRVLAEHDR